MDKNTLRRLAGIDTVNETTATSELNLIRRLAGIPTIALKKQSVLETPDAEEKDDEHVEAEMDHPEEEKDDEHVEAEMDHAEEESEEEKEEEESEEDQEQGKQEDGLLSFISTLATKAEGLEGDEMVELLMQIYHAGVEDGKNEEVKEDMQMSDDLAAKAPFSQKHRVGVTVSSPDHPMVSKRKEQIQKFVKVSADDEQHAMSKAKDFYAKRGYTVHDAHYHSMVEDSAEK